MPYFSGEGILEVLAGAGNGVGIASHQPLPVVAFSAGIMQNNKQRLDALGEEQV